MKNKTVLIVEDEKDLVELLEFNLHREGYRTLAAYDGETGQQLARQHVPDLIILDLMLPRKNGQEVAMALRAEPTTKRIPMIMLTAKSEESDIVVGLTLGADDYVTKPFSMKVLIARMETVMRRASQEVRPSDVMTLGPLKVDRSRHRAEIDDQPVALTLTEFRILEALLAARGHVLSRDQLMSHAWGEHVSVTDRTIDVHVTALRKKLGGHRHIVETVRGVGYRIAGYNHE